MASTYTKYIVGFLVVMLAATVVYVSLGEKVRLRVDKDDSTFYVRENNRWVIAGIEQNKLFNGTRLVYRSLINTKVETFIDNISNNVKITRTTPYYSGSQIIDTYYFDGGMKDIELFPIYHTIEIINGTGLIYQYEARRLIYDGLTQPVAENQMSFGRKMKITWDPDNYWAKVYKTGILKVRYRVNSDYKKVNIKMYDPPGITNITDCANLSTAGETYYLKANISNSASDPQCIYITEDNIIFDCLGNIIDGDARDGNLSGYGIHILNVENITVKNCRLTNWYDGNIQMTHTNSSTLENIEISSTRHGLISYFSSNNIFKNITANHNEEDGLMFSYGPCNNNTFDNLTANNNSKGVHITYNTASCTNNTLQNIKLENNEKGVYFSRLMSVTVINTTIINSSETGFRVDFTDNSTFINVTANFNAQYGIRLHSSSSNIIKESRFWNNTAGFYSSGNSSSNLIYNNLFNNTLNFGYTGIGNNSWNTTKQIGDRKVTYATEIGGNYWANLTGDGYSETCTDSDIDGFCDKEYNLTTDNTDYLPLSNKYNKTIIDCANLSIVGKTYHLKANISNSTISDCINITANNIILDCFNNIIDGDDSADRGINIERESTETTNAIIRNCELIDWDTANIRFKYADSNILTNITSTYSPDWGIRLYGSNNNTFTNITANNNSDDGIYFYQSSNNTLTNIAANNNSGGGIYIYEFSSNNILTNITMNNNSGNGIIIYSFSGNNTLIYAIANNNSGYGVNLGRNSSNNTVINTTANSNLIGILFSDSYNSTLTNVTAAFNEEGIYFYRNSSNNIVKKSEFLGNTVAGVFFDNAFTKQNIIYNNFFNNTLNFNYSDIGINSWNITNQTGTRVIMPHTKSIGGNFWAYPNGTGYSETCTDTNQDGYCNREYNLSIDNTDYLPYSKVFNFTPTNIFCEYNESCEDYWITRIDDINCSETDGWSETSYLIEGYYDSAWKNFCNHSINKYCNWSLSGISKQTDVDLRCRGLAIGIYSGYYELDTNITIWTDLVNLTYNYSCNISNYKIEFNASTQYNATPYDQNDICGVFNITSESSSNITADLYASINETNMNWTIRLGNSSNRGLALNLTTIPTVIHEGLAAGSSQMLWSWVSKNATNIHKWVFVIEAEV